MSVVCPNGHTSSSEDYCDTCGAPIDAAAAGREASSGAAPAPARAASAESTPAEGPPAGEAASGPVAGGQPANGTPPKGEPSPGRPPNGQAPSGSAAGGIPGGGSGLDLDAPVPAAGAAAEPSALDCPNCHTENVPGALFCEACGYDFTTGALPRESAAKAAASAPTATAASAANGGPDGGPGEPAFRWVAEVWVDPDWYGTQQAEDPCPSPGLPLIVPLRHTSLLLGRVSSSRNTNPEIDLSSDPGVSRRHAQLTTDGSRWFVEDLASSNGTFVGEAFGPLPTQPIAVGPKRELGDDERLYVGAWTRVVIREATPEEVEAYD